jgi:hypothetical protein
VNIRMVDREKLSLEAIGRFVEASQQIRFEAENRPQLYRWIERVLSARQLRPGERAEEMAAHGKACPRGSAELPCPVPRAAGDAL